MITHCREKHQEMKGLAQGHVARVRPEQSLNPGSMTPRPVLPAFPKGLFKNYLTEQVKFLLH